MIHKAWNFHWNLHKRIKLLLFLFIHRWVLGALSPGRRIVRMCTTYVSLASLTINVHRIDAVRCCSEHPSKLDILYKYILLFDWRRHTRTLFGQLPSIIDSLIAVRSPFGSLELAKVLNKKQTNLHRNGETDRLFPQLQLLHLGTYHRFNTQSARGHVWCHIQNDLLWA